MKKENKGIKKGWIPCTCPKGGMYEDINGRTYDCDKCGGTQYIKVINSNKGEK